MASFNSKYFKIGDKFDEGRFAIIRNEEVDGVEQTSVIKVGVDFLGCTLKPGVGLRSPEPENLVLLYDGSFIQYDQTDRPVKHTRVTGGNVSEDEIEFDKNGMAVINLNTGASIVLTEEGGHMAKADDSGKVKEMKDIMLDEKSLDDKKKEQEVRDTAISIIETITGTSKTEAFEFDAKGQPEDGYISENEISRKDENGITTKIKSFSTYKTNISSTFSTPAGEGAESSTEKVMFSITRNEGENVVENSALVDNGIDKFLYFTPTQEVLNYLATEEGKKFLTSENGKNPAIQIIGEGENAKYRFKVQNCTFTTASGFHVEANGGINFECNAGSVVLKMGDATFLSKITAQAKKGAKTATTNGYNIALDPEFFEKARKKQDGYDIARGKNGEMAEILDDDFVKNVTPDMIIGLLRSAGKYENGMRSYESNGLSILSCKFPSTGHEQNVLFVKMKDKSYVLHKGSFVELNADKLHEITEADPSKGRFKFSPKANSQGHYVTLTYDTNKLAENDLKVEAIAKFLGEKGTTVKPARVLNAHSNEQFTTELLSTKKKNIAKYTIKGLEPVKEPIKEKEEEKKDETNNETKDTEQTTTEKKPQKKGDPKKGSAFWNVISNASFYAMFFCLIACAFGLGFIAMPFALAFAAAGLVTKGIAYQGGFAANMTEEEMQNALNDAKENAKDKNLSKQQKKYKERQETIDKNNNKLAELEAKFAEYKANGLDASKDGRAIQAEIEKLKKENASLNKKNVKAEKKFTPLEALEIMGNRPNISEIDLDTTRENFGKNDSLYDSMVKNLLGQDLLMERQGHTMNHIWGQVDFNPQSYMLNANSVEFMNELTPAERVQIWGDISGLEEKYGGNQNYKYVDMFVEHDTLRRNQPLSTEDQKRYDELSETILTAEKEMGPKMFDSWSTFIRNEARERYENIANEYGIEDVQVVRNVIKNQKTIERLAGKQNRSTEEEQEFQTAKQEIEEVQRIIGEHSFEIEKEASLEKARADLENPLVANPTTIEEVEARYSNNPAYAEERIAHYGERYFPKLVSGLDKKGNTFSIADNPITIKAQLIDEYMAVLENKAVVTESFDKILEEDKQAVELFDKSKAQEIGKEIKDKILPPTVKEMLTRTSLVDSILRPEFSFSPNAGRPYVNLDMDKVRSDIDTALQREDIREPVFKSVAMENNVHSYELDHKTIEKYKAQGIDLLQFVESQKVIDKFDKIAETELSQDDKLALQKAEKFMADVGDKLMSTPEALAKIQDITENTIGGEVAIKKEIEKYNKKKLTTIQKDLSKNNLTAHIEELNRISAKYDINAYDLTRAEETIRTLGDKEKLNKKEQELLTQAKAAREQIAIRAAEARAFENGFKAYLKKNGYEEGKNVDQKIIEQLKKDYKKKYKQKFNGKPHKIAYGEEVLSEIYAELEDNNLLSPRPVSEKQATTLADADSQIDKLKKKTKLNGDEQKELRELEQRKAQIQQAIEEQKIKQDFEKYLDEYCKKNNITDKETVRKKAWAWYKKTLKDKTKRKKLNDEAMAEIMEEMKKQGVLEDEKEDEDVLSDDASVNPPAEEEHSDDKDKKEKEKPATPSGRGKKKKDAEKADDDTAKPKVESVYGESDAPKSTEGEYDMASGEEKKKDKNKNKKKRPTAGRTSNK